MLNKVILIGRTTKDVDLRKTSSGTAVATFTLAVDNRFVQKDGQNTADFISCVAWNSTAEFMNNYVKKGSLVAVEGRIQTRNYEGQDGKRVYVTEVVADSVQFLESKSQSQNRGASFGMEDPSMPSIEDMPQPTNIEEEDPFANFGSDIEISDDDLPF